MTNTIKEICPAGRDLWVKPYSKKSLHSDVFSYDGESKRLYRKKEKAVLKQELLQKVNSAAFVDDAWTDEDVELENLGFYD